MALLNLMPSGYVCPLAEEAQTDEKILSVQLPGGVVLRRKLGSDIVSIARDPDFFVGAFNVAVLESALRFLREGEVR